MGELSSLLAPCRYCLRLNDAEVCRECLDHKQTSGHLPSEVFWNPGAAASGYSILRQVRRRTEGFLRNVMEWRQPLWSGAVLPGLTRPSH